MDSPQSSQSMDGSKRVNTQRQKVETRKARSIKSHKSYRENLSLLAPSRAILPESQ